jgi:ASC-1-like (ASCH) protein
MDSIKTLKVDQPWLTLIWEGVKKVEGRKGNPRKYLGWVGQHAIFHYGQMEVAVQVVAARHYGTVPAYLQGEDWRIVAPHLNSYEEALDAYRSFPGNSNEEIARVGGMWALEVELVRVHAP